MKLMSENGCKSVGCVTKELDSSILLNVTFETRYESDLLCASACHTHSRFLPHSPEAGVNYKSCRDSNEYVLNRSALGIALQALGWAALDVS